MTDDFILCTFCDNVIRKKDIEDHYFIDVDDHYISDCLNYYEWRHKTDPILKKYKEGAFGPAELEEYEKNVKAIERREARRYNDMQTIAQVLDQYEKLIAIQKAKMLYFSNDATQVSKLAEKLKARQTDMKRHTEKLKKFEKLILSRCSALDTLKDIH